MSKKFHIVTRIIKVADSKGFRIYQVRSEGNRHLRMVSDLPAAERIENTLVLSPVELLISKIFSYHSRRSKPKAGTNYRDSGMLLMRFPELKKQVTEKLQAKNVGEEILKIWNEIAGQDFQFENEDEDLSF